MRVIKKETIKLPHSLTEITDSGADELRCAIIRHALEDYEDGVLWNEFVSDELIEKLHLSETEKINIDDTRWNVKRNYEDAQKFLLGKWCKILSGNLDVSKLVEQTKKNIYDKIALLSTPCRLYTGNKKHHTDYTDYDSLYNMQIDILKPSVTPTYFLTKIKIDNGKKYIEFEKKSHKYYVELGW